MSELKPGDLLSFHGTKPISRLISCWTWGPSHVGIVTHYRGVTTEGHYDGPLLVESTTLNDQPCVITGEKRKGVQAHYPGPRVAAYPGEVEVYRLSPIWSLDKGERQLLSRILIEHLVLKKRSYDNQGALIAGTRFIKWLPWYAADLESLFCSELCGAVLQRLGRLPILNPATYTPANLVRKVVRYGVYQRVC